MQPAIENPGRWPARFQWGIQFSHRKSRQDVSISSAMKQPADDSNQPGKRDRPERMDEETRAEILADVQRTKEMCLRSPEKVRAAGKDPEKLLREIEQAEAELRQSEQNADEAESALLNADANLADKVNEVAYVTAAFRIALEKELPALRARLNAAQLAEVEEVVRDWRENREDFLKPLTAEQRRTLGV
jgi:hypothetical protein